MNNMDNLSSYDNVEYLQAHEMPEEELHQYLKLKMETAQSNAEFIEKEIAAKSNCRLSVCEIGGGNGKLLYSLDRRGLLEKGVNYEVSKNRCDLAQRFAEILSCKNVESRNCNFLEDIPSGGAYDCIVMVDIVLQVISPLYDLAEKDTLEWIKCALKPGGYLFIEIIDYSDMMNDIMDRGEVCTWNEFPEGDPFEYSLNKFSLDKDRNLVWEKWFIGRRNDKRDYFKNVIRSYTPQEISRILQESGFDVKIYRIDDESLSEAERKNTYRILGRYNAE